MIKQEIPERDRQLIAEHPEIVAEVEKEFREARHTPFEQAVLNKIHYQQEKARVKVKREKMKFEMAAEAYLYLSDLERALAIIPTHPPEQIMEKDLMYIKAVWAVIIKRSKCFDLERLPGLEP